MIVLYIWKGNKRQNEHGRDFLLLTSETQQQDLGHLGLSRTSQVKPAKDKFQLQLNSRSNSHLTVCSPLTPIAKLSRSLAPGTIKISLQRSLPPSLPSHSPSSPARSLAQGRTKPSPAAEAEHMRHNTESTVPTYNKEKKGGGRTKTGVDMGGFSGFVHCVSLSAGVLLLYALRRNGWMFGRLLGSESFLRRGLVLSTDFTVTISFFSCISPLACGMG